MHPTLKFSHFHKVSQGCQVLSSFCPFLHQSNILHQGLCAAVAITSWGEIFWQLSGNLRVSIITTIGQHGGNYCGNYLVTWGKIYGGKDYKFDKKNFELSFQTWYDALNLTFKNTILSSLYRFYHEQINEKYLEQ